jgi:prevent-host-death family protein
MEVKSLPATEVKNRFGRVLREVSQTGGPIIVERDGKPVAVILSLGEYRRLQPQAAPPGEQLELLKAAFGLWEGRADIDEEWLADGRSRWESRWADG